ncbi:uncharacterized protein LOC116202654 [Punica granatum]|uniref:DUF7054 domain-containing protein n=2 Tax=Punica granatum TaxID=22663 RepID=A0A218XUA4_PUNGR|nr:uncharacterized protein LOC116202654 [Punica granatum]OWM88410.1 hypothetical protein CDL15_Pgr003822 [Punica granatum]PKI49495.1 hypothetical protein CRG98_030112 [Punica granatum]
MNLRSPAGGRCTSLSIPAISDRRQLDRSLQTFPPESHTDLVRRRGGLISVPRRVLAPAEGGAAQRLTKLLLNVTVERSLGPVQVVMPPESSVRDLIKAAVEMYAREKRRPLLKDANPRGFELHYSPFSLESLKPEEKLINLGSRNFFLCSRQSSSICPDNTSCSDEAKHDPVDNALMMTNLMDFLL